MRADFKPVSSELQTDFYGFSGLFFTYAKEERKLSRGRRHSYCLARRAAGRGAHASARARVHRVAYADSIRPPAHPQSLPLYLRGWVAVSFTPTHPPTPAPITHRPHRPAPAPAPAPTSPRSACRPPTPTPTHPPTPAPTPPLPHTDAHRPHPQPHPHYSVALAPNHRDGHRTQQHPHHHITS